MERNPPVALTLKFSKSPREEYTYFFDNMTPLAAQQLFNKTYLRFLLTRGKSSRKEAAMHGKTHPHSISGRIKKYRLEQEFPAIQWPICRYALDFTISPEDFFQFSGTLRELEDYYATQVKLAILRDWPMAGGKVRDRKVRRVLSKNPRDPYLGKILKRVARRRNSEHWEEKASSSPLKFTGTLRELHKRYIMQVLEQCDRDLVVAQKVLGIATRDNFIDKLTALGIGRGTSKKEN